MSAAEMDLVRQAQEGSLEAFDGIVALHQEKVFSLAYRILANREDAADAQQETFVRAWRSLGRFRLESSLATWLHRITVNLCLSRKRRKDWNGSVELDEEALVRSDQPNSTACMERTETALIVRRVLAALPSHYRVLLVLREIEERPFEDIAEILGCSAQCARVRASKARQMMKDRLRPYLAEEEL